MRVIGIETSCDETAVSIIEGKGENIKVLSNVISSQIKLHAKYGGVVPNLAAREHVRNIGHVFEAALTEAGIKNFRKQINVIAVTHGPGLGPALLVGITFAKTLAWHFKIPVVGVNHMDGHIHSNWLLRFAEIPPSPSLRDPGSSSPYKLSTSSRRHSRASDMAFFSKPIPLPSDFKKAEVFPALNLLVSGGHTELVLMKGHGKYEIIGETLDDAIGEAFDKAARLLGLGYPGGPAISKLAEKGNPDAYPLPQPMLNSKDFNFSYSGLKTAILYLVKDMGGPEKLSDGQRADLAASFQKAATDVLIAKTAKAIKSTGAKSVLLSGGVSANKTLRHKLAAMTEKTGVRYFCPPMEYTTDNAAMIAAAGYFKWKSMPAQARKKTGYESVSMSPNLSL